MTVGDDEDPIAQPRQFSANSFITLDESHLRCWHQIGRTDVTAFTPRAIVLARIAGSTLLEPVVVEETLFDGSVRVRRLLRRLLFKLDFKPNKLIYDDTLSTVTYRDLIRPCHVRSYTIAQLASGEVPPPYNYDGAGDCGIITGKFDSGNW